VPADRRVLDLCDLDSLKWRDCADRATGPRAWLLRSEAGRLAERERRWVDAFDASVLISEAEAATLDDDRRLREKVHVVTNGVDLPDEWMSTAPNRLPGAPPVASRVGFVGMMNYAPNVDAVCWFARECWPAIRRAIPDATFRIVGRAPSSAVRRLETIPGVEVTGPVDDVVAELAEIDVSVAPMRIARGVQNKILEAMAASRAVVLTRAAALGIAARDGHDFVVADAPTEIAQRIVDLLQDDKRRSRIGRNARRYVALNHRWEAAMLPFELIATGRIERTATARTTLHARDSLRREPPVEIDR